MKESVTEELKGKGLDVEFLAWLEGEDQRLPELERIREVKDADFAAAIRATEWLAQHFSEPELISPQTPENWLARYELLEASLHGALLSSLFYHLTSTAEDLAALERVLETLYPPGFWRQYRADIQHLRKNGLPVDLPKMKAKPRGGSPQSEQTFRMRAAIEYLSGVSKTPYGDLARFWNERVGEEKYIPAQMRDRLRKGHPISRGRGAARQLLESWQRVYHGDLRSVAPGPFLPSPKLKERYERRSD